MIPAGGSGTLTAKLKVRAGSSGTHSKTITVQTDDPQTPVLRLSLAYTAVNPILGTPSLRLYLNTVEGESDSVRVRLHREDGQPLEARIVDLNVGDGVSVAVDPVADGKATGASPIETSGDLWVVAETVAGSGALNQNGAVVLATNHPEVPKLEIPVYVRVRPLIEVRPNPVKLWPASGGPHGTSAHIRLSHSARKPFTVTGVDVSDPNLISARTTSQPDRSIQAVEIALADGVELTDGQVVHASVTINTSVEEKAVVVVPVVVIDQHESLRRRRPSSARQPSPGSPTIKGSN